MSQDYYSNKGASSSRGEGSSSGRDDEQSSQGNPSSWAPPQYLTVGNGATSSAAEALVASLNHDSGYGGSISGDSAMGGGDVTDWRAGLLEDRPVPAHTPTATGTFNPASEGGQVMSSHVLQLQYNQNRSKLARAITRTIETLKELQDMNRQWPAHYPSVQPSQRPSLHQTQSEYRGSGSQEVSPSRPAQIKRSMTSLSNEDSGESSAAAERRMPAEPRLMTPQIAQEFSILKLDLKLGALSQAELVHSLEKTSIASLLDGKISQSIKHLLSLRDRIEDTSSKVLVTGDLNAGKSTFCNALLRRKILPEDQQPCTSIFCEVLDARENDGIEEVHAIHKDQHYNRNDERTYDVFPLSELENIVIDNTKYMQCKVYVIDVRTIDESLLNNGVVDIALIDAPGLNSDSVKTTAVFARQEEIDVVVFVVSAANHFTLSAREFIMNAAHEKAYMFMVVNGFDNIRDKDRCQRMVLDQIAKMSPQTHKDCAELVHFVSSNAIPVAPGAVVSSGSGSGGADPSGDGPGDSDDDNDGEEKNAKAKKDKGKGKEKEKIEDFEKLESALRRFVLERRARSKLAPAKTYLLNVLADLNALAAVNRDVADSELKRVTAELDEIMPAYEDKKEKKTAIAEEIETAIEKSCDDVYGHTRSTLNNTIEKIAYSDLGVTYPGLFSAFQYAEDLKIAMLGQISEAVTGCENYARAKTVQGVAYIQQLGILHVGEDKFSPLNFRAENMFRKRRHALVRQIDTQVELWDFIDIPSLWERQEKFAGTGVAMTAVTVLGGRAIGGFGWVDGVFGAARILGSNNMRRMMVPGLIAAAFLTAAYILSVIPQTLPPRLSRKLAASLAEVDYVHSNASRISSDVRRVLRMPAANLQTELAQGIEDLGRRRDDVSKIKEESEVALKYFANLFRESQRNRTAVDQVDLEGPLPGALAQQVTQN